MVEPTLERWFTPSFIKSDPPILGMIRRQLLATPVEGFAGCIEAILRLNYRDRLSSIALPTLILVGEEDPGTPSLLASDPRTDQKFEIGDHPVSPSSPEC